MNKFLDIAKAVGLTAAFGVVTATLIVTTGAHAYNVVKVIKGNVEK